MNRHSRLESSVTNRAWGSDVWPRLRWGGGLPCLLGANAGWIEVDHHHAPEAPTDEDDVAVDHGRQAVGYGGALSGNPAPGEIARLCGR